MKNIVDGEKGGGVGWRGRGKWSRQDGLWIWSKFGGRSRRVGQLKKFRSR